jgi:hypothetical protein
MKKSSSVGNLTFHFIIGFIIYQIIGDFISSFIQEFAKIFLENASIDDTYKSICLFICVILCNLVLQFVATSLSLKSLLKKYDVLKEQITKLLINISIFFIIVSVLSATITVIENSNFILNLVINFIIFILMLVYINKSLTKHTISNDNFSYHNLDNNYNSNSSEKANLMNKTFNSNKIFIIVFIVIVLCFIIFGLIYNHKKLTNEQAEETLEDISISFETQSLVLAIKDNVSFKNAKCTSINDSSVECSNGEMLEFIPEDYNYKISDIVVKYNSDEEITYIEAIINGYKKYLRFEEKSQNEDTKKEEVENNSNENKITISCTSYEKNSDYKLETEFTVVYNQNIFVSYEQKNIEDYTSSSASAWKNALNNYNKYNKNNRDIVMDEKNKTITNYMGTNRSISNGNEDIFKKLNVTEAINKLETTFDATCSKYSG